MKNIITRLLQRTRQYVTGKDSVYISRSFHTTSLKIRPKASRNEKLTMGTIILQCNGVVICKIKDNHLENMYSFTFIDNSVQIDSLTLRLKGVSLSWDPFRLTKTINVELDEQKIR